MIEQYTYSSSIKSTASDELINTYFIRPAAGLIVRLLYRTIISPNQVTIASTFVGFAAAVLYVGGTQAHNLAAGLLITLKDILDSADGQLARAKNQYSRRGRFMDSIGDFFVNAFVFAAISTALYESSHSVWNVIPGIVGFFSLTLRVSYHVFYQTAFLHLNDRYTVNRLTEEVREEDLRQDAITLRLQTIFQWLYGWQDFLMKKIDEWSRAGLNHSQSNDIDWYGNLPALRISGFMGLGTELFLLTICSVTNLMNGYLYLNVGVMNVVWLAAVLCRRNLSGKIIAARNSRLL